MSEPLEALEQLDQHIADLQEALANQNWERLAELNQGVAAVIDPVMLELERGQLSATAVQQRLLAIQAFVEKADQRARTARDEARDALSDVGRNRKAASAYARVSSRGK